MEEANSTLERLEKKYSQIVEEFAPNIREKQSFTR